MVRCVLRLPEFSMDATSLSPNAFKKAKADQLEKFRKSVATALEAEKLCELSLCERFIVSYPTAECPTGHDVTTETGKLAGELSPAVIGRIFTMVENGLRDARAMHTIFKVEFKNETGRAHHPELKDIRSHSALAAHTLRQFRESRLKVALFNFSNLPDFTVFSRYRETNTELRHLRRPLVYVSREFFVPDHCRNPT
ncbi:uncharacterized protein LOC135830417 [Sycon ciliatum]|uniref:uncharacterized protein LOC135830417 n=1 Tax=Sycon ciliatum TaxID=27933 RepID=UPI0031F6EA8B